MKVIFNEVQHINVGLGSIERFVFGWSIVRLSWNGYWWGRHPAEKREMASLYVGERAR